MLRSWIHSVAFLAATSLIPMGGVRADYVVKPAKEACRAEIEKVCPGVKKGKELGKCVEEHLSELSAECQEGHKNRQERRAERKERRADRKERRDAAKDACAADKEKFCKEEKPGHGLFKCMKQHEAELSDGCKAAIKSLQESRPHHKKGKKGGQQGS